MTSFKSNDIFVYPFLRSHTLNAIVALTALISFVSVSVQRTNMSNVINVVVVDDHLVSRKGIISLLEQNSKIRIIAEGSAGNHVVELLDKHKPDVLITDLQMPANDMAVQNGMKFEPIRVLKQSLERSPDTSIIVISQEQDVTTIHGLAEIGVKGYFLKTDNFAQTLGQVVEMLQMGLTYFSPEIRDIIYAAPKLGRQNKLTEQQLNVLQAIIDSPELSREAIAKKMYISKSTLQKHISAIFEALNVPNMESCILKAMRMRLVRFDF